jgi:hypothetical protein
VIKASLVLTNFYNLQILNEKNMAAPPT